MFYFFIYPLNESKVDRKRIKKSTEIKSSQKCRGSMYTSDVMNATYHVQRRNLVRKSFVYGAR